MGKPLVALSGAFNAVFGAYVIALAAQRNGQEENAGQVKKIRNPIALIARQAAQQVIPDKRHAKKRRAQRKRDAERQERDGFS